MRSVLRYGAEHHDAVAGQPEQADGQRRADEPHHGPGEPAVNALGRHHDAEDKQPDAHHPSIDLAEVARHRTDTMQRGTAGRRQTQEVGELVDDDDHRDAREEPADDRSGEELGYPPQAQHADQHHERARQNSHLADERDVLGRAACRQVCDSDREQRRDRGVRPHRHLRVGAEQREEDGARHEREQAADRRHARQPRGGQLFGHGDGQQRERGESVGSRPGCAIAVQGGEQWLSQAQPKAGGCPLRPAHRISHPLGIASAKVSHAQRGFSPSDAQPRKQIAREAVP